MYAVLRDSADPQDAHQIKMGESLIIGRSYLKADVHVDDPLVSRNHCRVWLEEKGLFVQDLGSSNGSFVDGDQLDPSQALALATGKSLQIGRRYFQVQLVEDRQARPVQCAVCHRPISLDTLAGGEVLREAPERYVCPTCRPRERMANKFGTHAGSAQELPDFDLLEEAGGPPSIDDYEILGEIGRGRMGAIYRARKRSLGIEVAIKTLNAELAEVGEHVKRFHREARTEARLRHRNIVQVYDVGAVGSTHFIVMELVDGLSVYDYLAKHQQLKIPEALSVVHQVLAALEVAHTLNIVHRDVKPQNIMLARDGTAKLCDFGLAKDLADAYNLTARDIGMGTMAYMPPEQYLDAAAADTRADLYALGATTFHMLTGEPVFDSDDLSELVDLIFYAPPPLDKLPEGTPAELRIALDKLLEKEPDDRYQCAADVRKELDGVFRRYLGGFYTG